MFQVEHPNFSKLIIKIFFLFLTKTKWHKKLQISHFCSNFPILLHLIFVSEYQFRKDNLIIDTFWISQFLKLYILVFILFVTSNHQTTNLVFPNFFHETFSAWAVEKTTTLYWSKQNRFFFLRFGPMKSLFSFSSGQTEKNSQKKLWKTKFVVWWFDVTKKLHIFFEYPSWNSNLEWTLPYT